MNRTMIRTKSNELQIPFSHVLSGYLLESIVEIISQSSHGKDLWMGRERQLGLDHYKRKAPRKVSYVYQGSMELDTLCESLVEELGRGMALRNIQVEEHRLLREDAVEYLLHFSFSIDEMYVPFDIEILKRHQEHIFAQQETLRLFMENNRTISYLSYPAEQSIAYDLMEILRQLELLNEMEYYVCVYDILRKYPLEGRKVRDVLMNLCQEHHVSFTEKPFSLWKSYGDYTYMRKKWKVLLRKEGRKEPEWSEVHQLIGKFLGPIWQTIVDGTVFFGDWMPELERFLD